MAPSPSSRDARAQLIHEMSRELSQSRSRHSSHSPKSATRDSPTKSQNEMQTLSTLSIDENEALMSTRQLDDMTTNPLPELRSSARRFAYYNPPEPEYRIDTSVVNREFKDFEQSGGSDEDSLSIELGRGTKRSARSTPNKADSPGHMPFSMGNDSLYEVTSTPPVRARGTPRKSGGAEPSSLRREAQLRHAAVHGRDADDGSGSPHAKVSASKGMSRARDNERPRSTLAQMHAKATYEDDGSLSDDRPPTVTANVKNTRFGNPKSRQTSAAVADDGGQSPNASQVFDRPTRPTHTPRRVHGTPATAPGTATQLSFALPDLPNLTELVSGSFKDGTPVFSRSTKARSRFTNGNVGSRSASGPVHVPVDGMPVPEDEKAIFASLQLLREKVEELEQEKAQSQQKMDDYENDLAVLHAQLDSQEKRRSDSALGSTDNEGRKSGWKAEKTKLELSVTSLQNRVDRAERKLSVSDIAVKRLTKERDNLATQVSVAYYNSEELKTENEAVQNENEVLRQEVDALRNENDALHREYDKMRSRLSRVEGKYQDDTQNWTKKEADLQRKLSQKDRAVRAENDTLRAELAQVRAERDEDTQHWTRREAEIKAKTDKITQAEQAKLRTENDALKAKLADAQAAHADKVRRWKKKEEELLDQLDTRDETIRHFQELSPEEANDVLRFENDTLKNKLGEVNAQYHEQSQKWMKKEQRLREKIQNRDGSGRQLEDRARERRDEAETVKGYGVLRSGQGRTAGNSGKAEPQARSKSRSRLPDGAQNIRRSSAPQPSVPQLDSSDSEVESTTDLRPRKSKQSRSYDRNAMHPSEDEPQGDLTYLSFMDVDEIAKLRKMLEEERVAARRNGTLKQDDPTTRSVRNPNVPLKSALKDITRNAQNGEDLTARSRVSTTTPGGGEDEVCMTSRDWMNLSQHATQRPASRAAGENDTGASMLSTDSSRHRRRSAPTEMTSAFILPDITVRVPAHLIDNDDEDKENQPCPHNAKNCTLCTSLPTNVAPATAIKIPNPIPVSIRTAADDADATLRPAQPPRLALATVLKTLEDELTHLKRELAAQNALLQAHDASLGLRRRKRVQARIRALLLAVDRRGDMVYRLYDVVEGQRADELEGMEEGQVEETLRSVGMDPVEVRERKRGRNVVIESVRDEEGESDGSEELPWEGFSASQSLPSVRGGRRRIDV